MAQWVSRPRSDGAVSVQIKWRMDGRWQSETFTSVRLAAQFRTAVEEAGHRWPEGWIKGVGWSAPEPAPPAVTFADVAHGEKGYFARQDKRARLGKIKPKTVHTDSQPGPSRPRNPHSRGEPWDTHRPFTSLHNPGHLLLGETNAAPDLRIRN